MADILPVATLGRTGLSVTRLGYGAMELRDSLDDVANPILNAALDAGINFIDTSNDYGRSEEFIGKHISRRRSEYYLATKCGCPPGGGSHVWTRDNLFRGLNESLQRLKTDYVDLMQLHNAPVGDCEQGGLVDALKEMKAQGKVRWIGISTALTHLPTYLQWGVFDEFQIPYSALQRDHEDWIGKSAEAGIGTVIRGGVAQGEPGQGSGRQETWRRFQAANVDELREENESRSAFILRFTLSHPQIHTIIVGTKNQAHLRENVDAVLRGPLPPETYSDARRRLDRVGVKPAETS